MVSAFEGMNRKMAGARKISQAEMTEATRELKKIAQIKQALSRKQIALMALLGLGSGGAGLYAADYPKGFPDLAKYPIWTDNTNQSEPVFPMEDAVDTSGMTRLPPTQEEIDAIDAQMLINKVDTDELYNKYVVENDRRIAEEYLKPYRRDKGLAAADDEFMRAYEALAGSYGGENKIPPMMVDELAAKRDQAKRDIQADNAPASRFAGVQAPAGNLDLDLPDIPDQTAVAGK